MNIYSLLKVNSFFGGTLKKRMLQETYGRWSLFRVLCQRNFDKVMEVCRPFSFLFENGRFETTFGHEEKGSHRVQIEHGRL